MRTKNILLLFLLVFSSTLYSQNTSSEVSTANEQEKDWRDRLFLQLRGGINHSMNEDLRFGKFKHAISWGSDVAIGKEFNPFWGGIFDVAYNKNGGASHYSIGEFNQFHSMELFVNGTYNMTNGFTGLKKDRKAYTYAHLGVGMAYTFGLDDRDLYYPPKDNNFAVGVKGGFTYVYNVSRRVGLVADLSLTAFTDKFNGRKAGVPFDIHTNFEVGIRIHFGRGAVSWVKNPPIQYVDRIVEKRDTVTIIQKEVQVLEQESEIEKGYAKVYPIFFAINSIVIRDSEMGKITEMAEYMKENPEKIVFIIGHADINTGNQKINYYLGKNRAIVVSDYLIEHCDISPSRIINITEEGDKVQPYKVNYENNRVAICIISDFKE